MHRALTLALGIALALAALAPATARVSTLQVTNETNRCAAVTVFTATDTTSEMYELRYQKLRLLKPGESAVLSAMKGRLPAMHLMVRAYVGPTAVCARYIGVAQRAFISPRAALEVPMFHLVPAGGQFAMLGPGT